MVRILSDQDITRKIIGCAMKVHRTLDLLLNFGSERLEFKRKFRTPKTNPENPVNPVSFRSSSFP